MLIYHISILILSDCCQQHGFYRLWEVSEKSLDSGNPQKMGCSRWKVCDLEQQVKVFFLWVRAMFIWHVVSFI